MKKNKRLTLIEKKSQLEKKLIPILEKFTNSTGLVITNIKCIPNAETIYSEELQKQTGIKTIYSLNTEIEL